MAGVLAGPLNAQDIASATYTEPTTRYAHGVLGDAIEWGTLQITLDDGTTRQFVLPQDRVFEDVAPRVADLDHDGRLEVLVVETQAALGAQFAVYGPEGKITATPHIGRSNRWLAPVGAADLDGDGRIEIAYIDRPHLAKTLRIWRYEDQMLSPVADVAGLTNHRIGEPDIAGGIRDCGGGPEMITASQDWRFVMRTLYADGTWASEALFSHVDRSSFDRAMACN
ncbi:FG-GAP repeat domain-containing protein [Litoreibacter roseus]|uniref:FG-GAP repeat domain-containing protein n=1 Tax=Litoreibacter roseus TaxID=2601869 RepID=UPI001FAA6AAB|nr:VCBS repeat-containing protein [Litoreibacter roseus]